MKLLVLFAVVVLAVARPDNHYDTKYNNFNVDELVINKRLLCAYAHCFIGDGKCTPEGNDVKGWIQEGSETTCAKCTEKQKVLVAKFIKGLREHCSDEWKVLHKRGDPEEKHVDELEEFLVKYAN